MNSLDHRLTKSTRHAFVATARDIARRAQLTDVDVARWTALASELTRWAPDGRVRLTWADGELRLHLSAGEARDASMLRPLRSLANRLEMRPNTKACTEAIAAIRCTARPKIPAQLATGEDPAGLIDIIHDLTAALEDRDRTLVALQADIDRTTQGTLALHAELEESRLAIERAAEAKSRFLASMSHEIRTPLNSIIGMTHLMIASSEDNEQRRRLDAIRTSGRHLLTIINDVLDLAKIEAGHIDLESTPFSLQRTIEEAIEITGPGACEKHLEIGFTMADDVPTGLLGDPGRLRQVLVNLLSNAVKFTADGGVVVRVWQERRSTWFDVTDTGCGISQADQARLFRPFEQVGSTRSRVGGTGLGLAICRHLVEAMGGRIMVMSSPDEGATFRFNIKLPPARVDPGLPDTDVLRGMRVLLVDDHPLHLDILTETLERYGVECHGFTTSTAALEAEGPWDAAILDDLMPETSGPELSQALHAKSPDLPVVLASSDANALRARAVDGSIHTVLNKPLIASQLLDLLVAIRRGREVRRTEVIDAFDETLGKRHPLRILVAEDNELNRDLAKEYLAAFGYTCTFAANGEEAVAAVKANDYDLVLMDVEMPVMDGLAATRAIRDEFGDRLRVVAMTAHATPTYRERCMEVGMDDVVTKPVAPRDLAFQLRCTTRRSVHIPAQSAGRPRTAAIIDRLRPRVDQMLANEVPMLVTAFENGAAQDAAAIAHRMRPTVAIIGYADVADLLRQIDESGGEEGDMDALRRAVETVLALPA